MKKNTGVPGWLRWPWNLVVYILLAAVLRIFAIPVIISLVAWQKKLQPDGPEEGFCLERTRWRILRLGWTALYLFLALVSGVMCWVLYQEERTQWDAMKYAQFYLSGPLCVLFLALAFFMAYTNLRDALFPEKSSLAQSIRAQLPFPDGAPGVKELFAMVDNDIREHGLWFDKVAVGNEWVLGDSVTAISRIRVVFARDETVRRHAGGRIQTSRILELYLMDDRHQVQVSGLRNPNELKMLVECIHLRAPDALVRPYAEYARYRSMEDSEWEKLLLDFKVRQSRRESVLYDPKKGKS